MSKYITKEEWETEIKNTNLRIESYKNLIDVISFLSKWQKHKDNVSEFMYEINYHKEKLHECELSLHKLIAQGETYN